jgi:hypothetical protein
VRVLGGRPNQLGEAQSSKKKDCWDKADIVGKLATGFFSIAVTALAAYVAFLASQAVNRINQKQAEINNVDLRNKALQALGETDSTKKKLGKIALAGYGEAAIPTLELLLEQSDAALRSDGIDIASYLYTMQPYLRPTQPNLRAEVLKTLRRSLLDQRFALSAQMIYALADFYDKLPADDKSVILAALLDRLEPFTRGEAGDIDSLKQTLIFLRSTPGGRCSRTIMILVAQPKLGREAWYAALLALEAHIDSGRISRQELEAWERELEGPSYQRVARAGDLQRTLTKIHQAIEQPGSVR